MSIVPITEKFCPACEETKPASSFYVDRQRKDGLSYSCKSCVSQGRPCKNPAKRVILPLDASKTCSKCGVEKRLEQFHPSKSERFGRAAACINCKKKYAREHHLKNREQRNAWVKAHKMANAEKVKAAGRAYYQSNQEAVSARNKQWRENNPEVVRAYCRNRRALRASAGGKHTQQDVASKLASQKGKCHWCAQKISGTYHVDHVIPLIKGGTNGPENIVIACPSCNMRKQAKMPWDFAGRLF